MVIMTKFFFNFKILHVFVLILDPRSIGNKTQNHLTANDDMRNNGYLAKQKQEVTTVPV